MRMTDEEIRNYAAGIDPKEFPFFCVTTGELADSLWYVIRETLRNLFRHGFISRWKVTRCWQ